MYLQEVDWNHFSSSFFRCLAPIKTLTFFNEDTTDSIMINIINNDIPESLEIFCLNPFNPMDDVELVNDLYDVIMIL